MNGSNSAFCPGLFAEIRSKSGITGADFSLGDESDYTQIKSVNCKSLKRLKKAGVEALAG